MTLPWILLCLTCLPAGPQDKPRPANAAAEQKTATDQTSNTVLAYLALEQAGALAQKPATLEDAIHAALRNHPDIRVAQAKLQMAEAELAQARLLITQKVSAAHADLAAAKAHMQLAEHSYQRMVELQKRSAISATEFEETRMRLEAARATAAAKEASLHVLLGLPAQAGAPTEKANPNSVAAAMGAYLAASDVNSVVLYDEATKHLALRWLRTAPQPVADRLKAVLDKPVSMEKQQNVDLGTFLSELLKRASLDLKVRFPATENKQIYRDVTLLNLDAGEYPLRVWLQLVLDETNSYRTSPNPNSKPQRYDLYLREYGLLMTTPELAPPDAMTVQQFWKQLEAERAAKVTGETPKK